MSPQKNLGLDPSRYINSISRHPEFLRRLDASETLPRAIGGTATLLASMETKESGHRSNEGDVYDVIANINSFATASVALDKLEEEQYPSDGSYGRRLTDSEYAQKRRFSRDVITFNHAVKDLVDHQQSLTFGNVTTFITQMYVAINKPELQAFGEKFGLEAATKKRDVFYNSVRRRLNGMRHELGAEMILGAIEGIEYRSGSDEADPEVALRNEEKGIDYFVTINGYEFGVDIKASQKRLAAGKDKKQSLADARGGVVWSQLTPQDFIVRTVDGPRDGFRITRETALQKAPAMKAALMAAYHDEIQRRSQSRNG